MLNIYHKTFEHLQAEKQEKGSNKETLLQEMFKNTFREYSSVVFSLCKHSEIALLRCLNLWSSGMFVEISDTYIDVLAEKASPSVLIHCLTTVSSRVCFSERERVKLILSRIITRLFSSYSHQTVWALLPFHKSYERGRKEGFKEIYLRQTKNTQILFKKYSDLSTILIRLSNISLDKGKHFISKIFPVLKKEKFESLMLPIEKLLCSKNVVKNFGKNIFFNGFFDQIEVFKTLRSPKKLSIVGSNGKEYSFLLKQDDDLKKDSLFMEFVSNTNELLPVRLKVFSVSPLNEKSGLIEWVPSIKGMGSLIKEETYKNFDIKRLKNIFTRNNPMNEECFVNEVLPLCKPVLYKWFLSNFKTPAEWLNARVLYTKTAAVFSIIGYLVGLGDRHLQNILLDLNTGECVHVDFNILFEKGKKLSIPERVPFRLTQNMVNAMGVSGYEGFFRKTCEETLDIIKKNKGSFFSVLESIVYDPLVEWDKEREMSRRECGVHHLNIIKEKFDSKIDNGLPLSTKGHVNELIKQATDNKRLCLMYFGWAPYL